METKKILCDYCHRDLTTGEYAYDYSIRLTNRRIPASYPVVYDIVVYPPLQSNYDFCGKHCLEEFIKNDYKGRE